MRDASVYTRIDRDTTSNTLYNRERKTHKKKKTDFVSRDKFTDTDKSTTVARYSSQKGEKMYNRRGLLNYMY